MLEVVFPELLQCSSCASLDHVYRCWSVFNIYFRVFCWVSRDEHTSSEGEVEGWPGRVAPLLLLFRILPDAGGAPLHALCRLVALRALQALDEEAGFVEGFVRHIQSPEIKAVNNQLQLFYKLFSFFSKQRWVEARAMEEKLLDFLQNECGTHWSPLRHLATVLAAEGSAGGGVFSAVAIPRVAADQLGIEGGEGLEEFLLNLGLSASAPSKVGESCHWRAWPCFWWFFDGQWLISLNGTVSFLFVFYFKGSCFTIFQYERLKAIQVIFSEQLQWAQVYQSQYCHRRLLWLPVGTVQLRWRHCKGRTLLLTSERQGHLLLALDALDAENEGPEGQGRQGLSCPQLEDPELLALLNSEVLGLHSGVLRISEGLELQKVDVRAVPKVRVTTAKERAVASSCQLFSHFMKFWGRNEEVDPPMSCFVKFQTSPTFQEHQSRSQEASAPVVDAALVRILKCLGWQKTMVTHIPGGGLKCVD